MDNKLQSQKWNTYKSIRQILTNYDWLTSTLNKSTVKNFYKTAGKHKIPSLQLTISNFKAKQIEFVILLVYLLYY